MQYNIGDKVVRLQSRPNDMWVLGSTPVTIADLQDNNVKFLEQETLVGLDYWGLNCYELYQPKPTFTNKEQAMNSMVVSDLTPKKQRKLAALLVSKGYECSGDLNLKPNLVVSFNDKSFCVNFGSYSESLSNRTCIIATDKKYKAILAEVLAALPVDTVPPTLELKVGCKIRATRKDSPFYSEGAVGVWVGNDNVKFANERWCVKPENLVVVPDDTPGTDDKGNPVEVPQVFEVGCTVERTDGEHEGMEVGATSVVTALKEDGRHVELEDYPRGHSKRMLKVIKGA